MNSITVRFYGTLNYFLPAKKRQQTFTHILHDQPSVKDVIESLGVPHTEIDLLLINGKSTDFTRKLKGGEKVSVYPVFKSLDISSMTKVRPTSLCEYRFVLDVHLGKLASYLRMVGFDTLYTNDASDEQLANCSFSQQRILLTFDRGLLKRKKVEYGYCVRSKNPRTQLKEVIDRFDLIDRIQPFERCMQCNGNLIPVPKEDVLSSLPYYVRESLNEFHQCTKCNRVYWKGTHYRRMNDFIKNLKEETKRL